MSCANGRYQPLCRNLVVDVMTADELAAWVHGYTAAITLLGLSCGTRDESADIIATGIAGVPMPATSDVDFLRNYVGERVTKLRARCEGDVAIDARRRGCR